MHTKPVVAVRAALYLALSLIIVWLTACAKKTEPVIVESQGLAVTMESPEVFVQNLSPAGQALRSWQDLGPSLRKSLAYVNTKNPGTIAVDRPGLRLTWGEMAETLQSLLALLPELDAKPQLLLERFRWVDVGPILYSGYYEPSVVASRMPKPGYHPIYARPPELAAIRAKGRAYHSRKAIDGDGVLKGRGLELAWAKDIVDVFFLQIQGSGRLVYEEDGSSIFVNYDGQNGHKYKSSGRIMAAKGLLSHGHIFEQRQWFKNNPGRVWEILQDNPSYVFFTFGASGPTGAMGQVVEAWQSLAADRAYIPLGSVVAYGVNIPDQVHTNVPLRGIGLTQDVGGAIKRNRLDIFTGGDSRADYVASHLDASGPAWVLVRRR